MKKIFRLIIMALVMATAFTTILPVEAKAKPTVKITRGNPKNKTYFTSYTMTQIGNELQVNGVSSSAKLYNWTSSNPYVLRVSSRGDKGQSIMVKAVGVGKTTLTCQTNDGAVAKVTITVVDQRKTSKAFVERALIEMTNSDIEYIDRKNLTAPYLKMLKEGKTAADVLLKLYNSKDFKKLQFTNKQYVEMLYRVLFGRNPSTAEVNNWTKQLKTKSRKDVLKGFVNSKEFGNLCKTMKIKQGKL